MNTNNPLHEPEIRWHVPLDVSWKNQPMTSMLSTRATLRR